MGVKGLGEKEDGEKRRGKEERRKIGGIKRKQENQKLLAVHLSLTKYLDLTIVFKELYKRRKKLGFYALYKL